MRLIICDCEVEYEGRVNTSLGLGERLIIFKNDGSFSLHNDNGYKPLNYMTPPTTVWVNDQLITEMGKSKIKSGNTIVVRQSKTGEQVTLSINEVKLDRQEIIKDEAVMERVGSEKDFQAALALHPEAIEEGLIVLQREKSLKVGIMDLYCKDKKGKTVIIEVKRAVVTAADVDQLARYVDEVVEEGSLKRSKVRGILVAPKLMPQAEVIMIKRKLEFVPISFGDVSGEDTSKLFQL